MKILITGGAGFIGSHIAEKFNNEGGEVFIVDNLSTGKRENVSFIDDDHFYQNDVKDFELLSELVKVHQFDYVFHLAAMVSVVETVEKPVASNGDNIDSTIHLLEANREHNSNLKKFLFASSAAIYGDLPDLPKSTDSKINPLSPYAVQKFASEQYTKIYHTLYGLPTVSLRFFNVYGPRQNPESDYSGVLSILNQKFLNKAPFTFFGDGKQTRDFIYIKDLLQAIWLVINDEQTNGKIYNAGTGDQTELRTVFNAFAEYFGYEVPYSFEDARKGDIKYSYSDVSPLKALGYQPDYPINKGIAAYLDYNEQ
ncbi:NAD-dependent epimerase/dehydratase family protein [Staphylococcus simulans]|uniref:NAD-dependent epimerase/dehydratase family protein n=1 Tax=Staphylococcus simulans TaxID=1286 RepID=UPI000D026EB1|nr:NAD-dependent epimerase/dehydratase family protein [Staphylococcus simulans]MCD8915944.1 NAD-dependent epimerase/dehydratase family protein [Staphylococcus simulans]